MIRWYLYYDTIQSILWYNTIYMRHDTMVFILWYNTISIRHDTMVFISWYNTISIRYDAMVFILWYHTLSIRYDTDGIYIMVPYTLDTVWYEWYLYNGTIPSRYSTMISLFLYIASTYWLKTRSDFFVTLQLTQERCHYL